MALAVGANGFPSFKKANFGFLTQLKIFG